MKGTQPDQIDGSKNHHLSKNIFTHASVNCHLYLSVDRMKPPKFYDLLCDDSRTRQEIEAIQLLLVVTSSSYDHGDAPETSQTRVSRSKDSKMTIPICHTPLSTDVLDFNSSGQAYHSSDASLSTYFYSLTVDMQQPIFSNLFTGGKTPIIVSNPFGCCPANASCIQAQLCDVWQTFLLPKNISVNSPHPGKSKKSNTLDFQSAGVQTFG